MWRKPDILVDCVLRLVSKEPGAITGQALIDEDFLRAEGVMDSARMRVWRDEAAAVDVGYARLNSRSASVES